MSADIQVIGDEILFDGQKVARFHSNLNPSLRFGFTEVLSEIKTEQELADETTEAENEAADEAKRGIISEIREAIEKMDFGGDGDETEREINKLLDGLEPTA